MALRIRSQVANPDIVGATQLTATSVVLNGGCASPENAYGFPDQLYTANSGSIDWSAIWQMGTPSAAPSGEQWITVYLKKDQTAQGNPYAMVSLYENGVFVRDIVGANITDSTSSLSGTFDASEITDPSQVQIRVGITSTENVVPANIRNVQVDGIVWDAVVEGLGVEQRIGHVHRLDEGGRPGVILLHGRGADATVFDNYYGPYNDFVYQLVRYGCICLSIDAGGRYNWGGPLAVSAIASAKTYLQGTLGAAAGQVALVGISMGATGAINYARQYPAEVSGLALMYPAVDIEDILIAQPQLEGEVNGAYGASDATTRAPHDPAQNVADLLDGGNLRWPMKLWYSTNDPVCRQDAVLAFAAATGAETESVGADGHGLIKMPPEGVATWVRSL